MSLDGKLHRHGDGVAVHDGHAVAVRAHRRGEIADTVSVEVAEDLLRLLLHLLFFAADEGDHVPHNVHGRHARIARAGDGLHRGGDDLRDAEGLERRQPHGQHHGRAVRVGHDLPLPSARALLDRNELQVIRVDLRHQQRHVELHAVVARVGDDHVARLGEGLLDLGGHAGVRRREDQLRRVAGLAFFDHDIGHRGGSLAAQVPLRGVAVLLAGRAVARAEPRQVEPGMILQKLHEVLAHHSGAAKYADFYSSFHVSPFTTR